jgi:hypothetical protein
VNTNLLFVFSNDFKLVGYSVVKTGQLIGKMATLRSIIGFYIFKNKFIYWVN